MKGLTVEEVIEYQRTHLYKKQVYGKWGNLKYQYLKDIGVDWTIVDLFFVQMSALIFNYFFNC